MDEWHAYGNFCAWPDYANDRLTVGKSVDGPVVVLVVEGGVLKTAVVVGKRVVDVPVVTLVGEVIVVPTAVDNDVTEGDELIDTELEVKAIVDVESSIDTEVGTGVMEMKPEGENDIVGDGDEIDGIEIFEERDDIIMVLTEEGDDNVVAITMEEGDNAVDENMIDDIAVVKADEIEEDGTAVGRNEVDEFCS